VCTSIGSSVSIILSRFRGWGGSEARRTKGWVNRLIYLWKFAAKAAGFVLPDAADFGGLAAIEAGCV
jgi:hypothetical protein